MRTFDLFQESISMKLCDLLPRFPGERGFESPKQVQAHVGVGVFGSEVRFCGTEFPKLCDGMDTGTSEHLLGLGAEAFAVANRLGVIHGELAYPGCKNGCILTTSNSIHT